MTWDKTWMRRAFDRAAPGYDRLAALQRRVGERLLASLPPTLASGWMLDIGAGTGWCARRLARRYPGHPVLLVDIAEGMLHQARLRGLGAVGRLLVGDAEALPVADAQASIVVTNLALQWCLQPESALAEMGRVLQPGGGLWFSTFALGTLEELRRAWRRVDAHSHVNTFVTPGYLAEALRRSGFRHWQLESETIVLRYPSLLSLMRELKGIGAHNVTRERPRHLLAKGALRALEAAYPAEAGGIPARFVAVYGWAVK